MNVVNLLEMLKSSMRIIGPLAVFAVAIILCWSLIKWTKTLGQAMKELAESPFSFLFAMVVVAILMFVYFSYIDPYFR